MNPIKAKHSCLDGSHSQVQLGLGLVIPGFSLINNQANGSLRFIGLTHAGLVGRRTNTDHRTTYANTPETTLAAAVTRILPGCERCRRAVRVANV
jgi:hypothetical protein